MDLILPDVLRAKAKRDRPKYLAKSSIAWI
jgi:hypothetical protein